jgi:two-component system response regulator DctR
MRGLALFEQMIEKQRHLTMPVIFLTGHADVPTAVQAVKRGAFDFCEKPFSDNALVDRIEQAVLVSQERTSSHRSHAMIHRKLGELTEREQHVMRLVVEGLPNKRIAEQLDISVQTAEVPRFRVFDKMQVKSALELTNRLRTLPQP